MRDYLCKWEDQRTAIKIADLSTSMIHQMLDYIKNGGEVDPDDAEDMDAVIDRLKLELDIRAWGFYHD